MGTAEFGFGSREEALEGAKELHVKGWEVSELKHDPRSGQWSVVTKGYSEPSYITEIRSGGPPPSHPLYPRTELTPVQKAEMIRERAREEAKQVRIEEGETREVETGKIMKGPAGEPGGPPTGHAIILGPGAIVKKPDKYPVVVTKDAGKLGTITTEQIIRQAEKEEAQIKLAETYEKEFPPGEFSSGFIQSVPGLALAVSPKVREATAKYTSKYPEDVLRGVAISTVTWPVEVAVDVPKKIREGRGPEAVGELLGVGVTVALTLGTASGLARIGRALKPRILGILPRTGKVSIEIPETFGVSKTKTTVKPSPTGGVAKSRSLGMFETQTGKIKGLKGGITSETTRIGKTTTGTTVTMIPKQEIKGVTIEPTVDVVFTKAGKKIGKIYTTGYSEKALDIIKTPGKGTVRVLSYEKPKLTIETVTERLAIDVSTGEKVRIGRALIGEKKGVTLLRKTFEVERGELKIRGYEGGSIEAKTGVTELRAQKTKWIDIEKRTILPGEKAPTPFKSPGRGKGPVSKIEADIKTEMPPMGPQRKIDIKIKGRGKDIEALTGPRPKPRARTGLETAVTIPVVAVTQAVKRTARERTRLAYAPAYKVDIGLVPRIGERIRPGQKLTEELRIAMTPIEIQAPREKLMTTLVPAMATTTTTDIYIPPTPPTPPPPGPGIPIVPIIPLLGGYWKLGPLKVFSYRTKWIRNPVPDIKDII